MPTNSATAPIPPARVAAAAFERAFGARAKYCSRAPGRVNLIGGHIDYSEGLVLPMAIEPEVAVAFRPRRDRRLRVFSADYQETSEFEIDHLVPGSLSGWASYPAGVAWSLEQAALTLGGIDAAVAGNVPIGGGLSSSAAIEVAFASALRHASELELADLELAKIAQFAENRFVGVHCGIMDQITAACAERDKALLIDCRSLEMRPIPMPPEIRVVVLGTGVQRELRWSAFNQRRRECEQAVARLAAVVGGIRSLRDVPLEQLAPLLEHLPPPLDRRVRHVVGEIERVRLAAAALEAAELDRFGKLMFDSHHSSCENYQVTNEELDSLVDLASRAPGGIGARLSGGGFGGCTVNVVRSELVEAFIDYTAEAYSRKFGRRPHAFVTGARQGSTVHRLPD